MSLLDAEPTDCVVVEIRGLPIHVGVYVGDIDGRRSMLHTMEARGHSMIEPIFSPSKLGYHPTFWRHPKLASASCVPLPEGFFHSLPGAGRFSPGALQSGNWLDWRVCRLW